MRLLLLVSTVGMVTASAGGSRASSPERDPTHMAPCAVVGDDDLCPNLLAEAWSKKKNDSDAVKELLTKIKAMQPNPNASAPVTRRSSLECRLDPGSWFKPKPVSASYRAVAAMERFPEAVNGREFVAGTFQIVSDEGCWEAEYGVRKSTGDWTRELQFMTVRLERPFDSANAPETNEPYGRWTTWAISSQSKDDGTKAYRLERLEGGDFVRCGAPHPLGQWSGFFGCKPLKLASDSVAAFLRTHPTESSVSLNDFLGRYLKGDFSTLAPTPNGQGTLGSLTAATVTKDAFYDGLARLLARPDYNESEAWMQCGALGCCTAAN